MLGRMLGAVQSLKAGSLLSMKIKGQCGYSQTPLIGLRQGCALSVNLYGISISELHQKPQLQLTDLVHSNEIWPLASSPHHLQPFIDALGGYSATVHMEISVAKMKVMIMVVSNPCVSSPAPVTAVVTCNGHSAH